MPGEAIERVRRTAGVILPVDDYLMEFYECFQDVEGVVWKLERAQHFHEPDVPSWVAMMDGDWRRALTLIKEMRFSRDLPSRIELRRLRIVETPLTPYMQWELELLAARTRAGERARVLPASAVRWLERAAPLPELVILGPDLMYEVLYDRAGAHTGGRRITDMSLIEECVGIMAELYGAAEDLLDHYEREVAPLPPPAVSRVSS
ncbi:hypothetical protein GCM10023194_22850 [Planotetraspora phitsanulokensis]|uniref:DUF6879 domain-containing protein n=1 Tax=Planotetraspora phitsanulokensis TaxID=575192 RepID=A0A8J3U5D4_9ACTN|nr:DUF6879 family protein [Planotetraspora phitsanulokensis]GII38342.1 hypothetical protein Pph01_33450 [Planotetraspora phitsanulokensis]